MELRFTGSERPAVALRAGANAENRLLPHFKMPASIDSLTHLKMPA
jgi:hypothetical protein